MGMKPFSGSAQARAETMNKALSLLGKGKANRYRPDSSEAKNRSAGAAGLAGGFAFLRYAVGFSGLALIFAGLGVILTHGYNFFIASPYFALEYIEITGNKRLDAAEILRDMGIYKGKSVLAVSMGEMEAVLRNNRWIAEFTIRRVLPGGFKISIRERSPEYLVNRDGVLYYADLRGAPIKPASANDFSSLPALEIEKGAEEFADRLPELIKGFKAADVPLDSAALDWLRLSAAGMLELRVNSYLRVVVGFDEWERNLAHLQQVFADLSRRGELRDTAEIRAQGSNVWVLKKTDI
jgi:cell division protein FtsQ